MVKALMRKAGIVLAAFAWAGVAAAQESAEDAPPPDAGCGAGFCLSIVLSPELEAELDQSAVSLEALADGISARYAGPEPVAVRLIAARYDNGRLVRFGVSDRVSLEAGEDLAVAGAAAAIDRGLTPATHRVAEVAAVEAGAESAPALLQSFVGNVPPTYLAGEAGGALFSADVGDRYEGSIGVILLEPDLPALRDGAAAKSEAAVVQLNLVRP